MDILVIDDNPEIDKMLKKFLELKGNKCTITTNGRMGLNIMRQHKFDSIILDLAMPEFTGFDVINELSKSGEIKNQKITVLTAATVTEDKANDLRKTGVNAVLRKPVGTDVLLKTIGID